MRFCLLLLRPVLQFHWLSITSSQCVIPVLIGPSKWAQITSTMYHVGQGTRPCPFPVTGNGHGRVIEPKGDYFSGRNLGMIPYLNKCNAWLHIHQGHDCCSLKFSSNPKCGVVFWSLCNNCQSAGLLLRSDCRPGSLEKTRPDRKNKGERW